MVFSKFYKLKARDDILAIRRANVPSVRDNRLRRITQDIRRIGLANQGNRKAFHRVLDIAYGRKGKLRHELLEPFLPAQDEAKQPKLIPFLERSRPPTYTPALKALLSSEFARKSKALKPSYMDKPPTLPEKADPNSLEARTFGRLSKRREVNIRWRYFTNEIRKIFPPVEVRHRLTEDDHKHSTPDVRGGMQGLGLIEGIETIVGPLHTPPPMTRRERRSRQLSISATTAVQVSGHPSRWVRRRYRHLLGKLPVIAFNPRAKSGSPAAFSLGLSPRTFPQYQRSIWHMPQADDVTQAWNTQRIAEKDGK
ncbi:hypothetical protein BJ165DRAFT_1522450 [Panaeolus papilionaceus]|nr:hypothetical protein BJ165DRAFT_1522450 [Panaeolus papilionaceus]